MVKPISISHQTELFCERYKIREARERAKAPTSIFFSTTEAVDDIITSVGITQLNLMVKNKIVSLNVANESVLDYLNAKLTTNENKLSTEPDYVSAHESTGFIPTPGTNGLLHIRV